MNSLCRRVSALEDCVPRATQEEIDASLKDCAEKELALYHYDGPPTPDELTAFENSVDHMISISPRKGHR